MEENTQQAENVQRVEPDVQAPQDGLASMVSDSSMQQPLLGPMVQQIQQPKKSFSWIKLLRVLIWGVVAVFLPVGISVIRSADLSSAYADGSYIAREKWGNIIFWIALVVGILNLVWGTVRWVLRWKKEKWTAGKVAGKLIGGGLWRTCAVLPVVILSLFFIAPAIINAVGSGEAEQNFGLAIDSLPEFNEDIDDLDADALQEMLDAMTLANIDFDIDASSNVVGRASLFSQPAYAQTKKVTVLNKAQKSPSGNFVLFYTDTGDDAVSDEEVVRLGKEFDKITGRYKENFQLQYAYDMAKAGILKEEKIKKVLKNNNLEEDLLDRAMPVYIARTVSEGSTVLAYYAGIDTAKILNRIAMRLDSLADINDKTKSSFALSVPSFPFIAVNSQNLRDESLEQIISHELGHHYSNLFCQANYGIARDGSNMFTSETVANYLAAKISDNTTSEESFLRNWQNNGYLKLGVVMSLDKIVPANIGYGSYAFLLNYTDIVDNGFNIAMSSLCTNDALEFLHDQAGEKKFAEVMTKLAEKNLTNDYGNLKAVRAYDGVLPVGEEAPCSDFCSKDYQVSYASMRYVYFPTGEYRNKKITVENDGAILFVGKDRSGKWKVIKTEEGKGEYSIGKESDYKVIAVAVINSDIENDHIASIMVMDGDLAEEIDGPGGLEDLSFSLPTDILSPIGQGCYAVNTNSLFELPKSMFGVAGSAIDFMSEFDSENDYSEIKKEFNDSIAEYDREAEAAKKELSEYYITLCINEMNGSDFDSTKQKIQSAMGFNFNVMDQIIDSSNRTSLFVSGDIFTQTAKLYSLTQADDEMILVTVNIRKNS